jgi:hypothetical protein
MKCEMHRIGDIIRVEVNELLGSAVGDRVSTGSILVRTQRWIETGANLPHARRLLKLEGQACYAWHTTAIRHEQEASGSIGPIPECHEDKPKALEREELGSLAVGEWAG